MPGTLVLLIGSGLCLHTKYKEMILVEMQDFFTKKKKDSESNYGTWWPGPG